MSIDFRNQSDAVDPDVSQFMLESEVNTPTNRAADERAFDINDNEQQWQSLWDRLIDWNRTPSHVDEDELESPSPAAIRRGSNLLIQLKRQNPREIPILAPDGEGGISIEFRFDNGTTILHEIDRQGAIEVLKLVNSKLVMRSKF